MSKPCVMDIKIGKITYGPDASQEKKDRESKSYAGTKLPYGYSVCGIIVHSDQVKVSTTFRSSFHNNHNHLPPDIDGKFEYYSMSRGCTSGTRSSEKLWKNPRLIQFWATS